MKKFAPLIILHVGAICGSSAWGAPLQKKLFQWGFDDPYTGFFPANIEEMKTTPLDGTVFTARPNNGTNNEFTWQSWGTTTFTRAQMQHAVNELQATNFGRFSENFLRFNTTPANVDWFDDFN